MQGIVRYSIIMLLYCIEHIIIIRIFVNWLYEDIKHVKIRQTLSHIVIVIGLNYYQLNDFIVAVICTLSHKLLLLYHNQVCKVKRYTI